MEDPDEPSIPDEDESEELEAEIEQAERPFAVDSFGTTAEEQRHGESLDQRIAQEQSEGRRSERPIDIVDDGIPDEEAELVGEGVTDPDLLAAPEEAAMHVRPNAPGATDHEEEAVEEEE
jgi:hypothetical protein